jgi:hypothetical protein
MARIRQHDFGELRDQLGLAELWKLYCVDVRDRIRDYLDHRDVFGGLRTDSTAPHVTDFCEQQYCVPGKSQNYSGRPHFQSPQETIAFNCTKQVLLVFLCRIPDIDQQGNVDRGETGMLLFDNTELSSQCRHRHLDIVPDSI